MAGRQHGQAAVESVGITIAIALLLAATSLWLAREFAPPARPPDVVATVAAPLEPGLAQAAQALPGATLPLFLETLGRGGGRSFRRALRTIGRGIATGVVLAAEGDRGFREGYLDRLRERAVELIHNPLGGLTTFPDPSLLTPMGLTNRLLQRRGELRDYVRHLRTLEPEVAARTVGRDLGEAAADLTVNLGEAALRRRLAARVGRPLPRMPRRPASGAPAP